MAIDGVQRQPQVLVVDDEALVGICLADDLESAGYRVTGPFTRSADALASLGAEPPDAAIIDIGLRRGCGLDVARECRRRDVPFVFFSGDDASAYRTVGEFAGAAWVDKPALLGTIIDALRTACGLRGIDGAASASGQGPRSAGHVVARGLSRGAGSVAPARDRLELSAVANDDVGALRPNHLVAFEERGAPP